MTPYIMMIAGAYWLIFAFLFDGDNFMSTVILQVIPAILAITVLSLGIMSAPIFQ